MIDGNEILSQLKKLRDVTTSKDIRQLTYAMFPGTHCPLMGAAMAVRGIKDAVLLVVGTDECAYYTKHMTLHSDDFGGLGGRCVSAVLDTRDVTFGCKAKLDSAVAELVTEYKPRAVFVVTTCVVEVIGDDTDSMADAYTEQYGIPFLSVHTEHFKCENHLPGLERTITACFDLMQQCPPAGTVNLLGQRMGKFETTELSRILRDNGVKIGMQLPCGCTVDEIVTAASAKVNIVVNAIALPLAQKMQEKFGTPYVFFDKYTDPDRILKTYETLFTALEMELPAEIKELYRKAKDAAAKAKPELQGVSYIYGNTPFDCLEFNQFMVKLGMVPQIIQTVSVEPERDQEYLTDILANADPYVTKTANIAPLQYVYDVLHPSLYLGHEYAPRLRKKGIAVVRSDAASGMLGFEITEFISRELVRASQEAKGYQKEVLA